MIKVPGLIGHAAFTALDKLDSFSKDRFDGFTDKHLKEHLAYRTSAITTTVSIALTASTVELGAYDRRVKPWRQKLARVALPTMAADLALGYFELYRRRSDPMSRTDVQL